MNFNYGLVRAERLRACAVAVMASPTIAKLEKALRFEYSCGNNPMVLRITEEIDKKLCAELNAIAIMYPSYEPIHTLAGAFFHGVGIRVEAARDMFYFEG